MSIRRYNLSYLHEISGGDEDFILDMVSTFVNNSPLELSEMNSLADEKKWQVLGEHAHKFAPGLQFLGLVSLRPVINQIEDFAFNLKNLDQIPGLLDKLIKECNLVSNELKKDFNI